MSFFELRTERGSMSVRRLTIRDGVSELFRIDALIRAPDPNVDLGAIVGREATLVIDPGDGTDTVRSWIGVVSHMQLSRGIRRELSREALTESTYEVRLVPKVWLASHRRNHRIFQGKTIPEIVDQVLEEWSVDRDWKDVERPRYPRLEYKVQYAESDLAFVTRLLEEAGIAWLFATEVAGEKLVLSDTIASRPPRKHPQPILFEDSTMGHHDREWIGDVQIGHEVRPGTHLLVDFDFRHPSYDKRAESPKVEGLEGRYEQVEYAPGSFLVVEDGAKDTPAADALLRARYADEHGVRRSTIAHEAERTGRRHVRFETNILTLQPGTELQIMNHPHELLEKKLLVTAFTFEGTTEGAWSVRGEATFADEPWRPARVTPKPQVLGVQSATVVGPGGNPQRAADNPEIHTDEFGRVRVQFPWDREGQKDVHSSCWMRVAQGWAGLGFGMIALPRVGQEVLVGFLAGDPDQPLVMGRVFDAINPVPYKLPDHKTQSGWRTWSSPRSRAADQTPYNELKFEDDAGKELLYIQAQRDLHQLVKHNQVVRVKRHDVRTVEQNQHATVKQTKRELVEVDDHLHVKGNRAQAIDGSTSLTVGADQDVVVGSKHALEAGQEIHLKAGSVLVLEAGSKLSLKGPGGFIDIHGGGVDISGTLVKINSGGSPATGSGASPTAPKDALDAAPQDESAPDAQYDEG